MIMFCMDSIPTEIWECIVYLLDNDSLNNFIEVYTKFGPFRLTEKDGINWSIVYKYRFGDYTYMTYSEYFARISIEKLIYKLKLYRGVETSTNLHLNDSQIKEIPKEIEFLTNLETIYLDNNQITKIPVELCKLTNLVILNLNHNQIRVIPKKLAI